MTKRIQARTIPACQVRAGELVRLPRSLVKWEVLDWVSSIGLTVIRSKKSGDTRTVKGDYRLVPVGRRMGAA